MHHYITTRRFPAALTCHVGDMIPRHARSVQIGEDDAGVWATATAHENEIHHVRRAIRAAKLAASVAHIR